MARLALLVPLLLYGCALLRLVLPSPPAGIEHDGYILVCEGIEERWCIPEADNVAATFNLGPSDFEIAWIVVRADGYEVCWRSPIGDGCHEGIILD